MYLRILKLIYLHKNICPDSSVSFVYARVSLFPSLIHHLLEAEDSLKTSYLSSVFPIFILACTIIMKHLVSLLLFYFDFELVVLFM